jgi:SAM-dependent methyltransferase
MILEIQRKLLRALAIYREAGISGLWRRLAWRLPGFARDDHDHSNWLQWKAQVDCTFDATHGIRTGGIEEIYRFKIVGENARYERSHIATRPEGFDAMMNEQNIDCSPFTFVDLGSGRGRALILAAAYPFRRIIGVEFAEELHRAAHENIAALTEKDGPDSRIELVHGDALTFEFPNDPLIVYLFNPFSATAVRRVAKTIMDSWRASPRPIRILYMTPDCLSDFVAAGWKPAKESGFYACLVPP